MQPVKVDGPVGPVVPLPPVLAVGVVVPTCPVPLDVPAGPPIGPAGGGVGGGLFEDSGVVLLLLR